MNTSNGKGSSFLGRLGFVNAKKPAVENPSLNTKGSLLNEALGQLLDDICSCLFAHNLEVSPSKLSIAHGAFSGANPSSARQLAARARLGENGYSSLDR